MIVIQGALEAGQAIMVNTPLIDYPIPQNYSVQTVTQEFAVVQEGYKKPDRNAGHPTLGGKFIEQSSISSLGGGVIKFTNKYLLSGSLAQGETTTAEGGFSNIPESYNNVEIENMVVNFPAFRLDTFTFIEKLQLGYKRGTRTLFTPQELIRTGQNFIARDAFSKSVPVVKTTKIVSSTGSNTTEGSIDNIPNGVNFRHPSGYLIRHRNQSQQIGGNEAFKVTLAGEEIVKARMIKFVEENGATTGTFDRYFQDDRLKPDKVINVGYEALDSLAKVEGTPLTVDYVSDNTSPSLTAYAALIGRNTMVPFEKKTEPFEGDFSIETSYTCAYQ